MLIFFILNKPNLTNQEVWVIKMIQNNSAIINMYLYPVINRILTTKDSDNNALYKGIKMGAHVPKLPQ